MKCQPCVQECKERRAGYARRKTRTIASYYEEWMYDQDAEHRRAAHVMMLTGGYYRCGMGHVDGSAPSRSNAGCWAAADALGHKETA